MRLFLVLVLTALLTTASYADDAEFDFENSDARKALGSYNAQVTKNRKEMAQKIKQVKDKGVATAKKNHKAFIESLQKALKKSMRASNLNEANKINNAITALQQGNIPPGDVVAGKDAEKTKQFLLSSVIDVWVSSDGKAIYIIRPNGAAIRGTIRNWGKWEAKDLIKDTGKYESFTVKWSEKKTDRNGKLRSATTITEIVKVGENKGERFLGVDKLVFLLDKYFNVREDL